jgi:MFS transporter, PHS family, inorganic phosphate transporter
MPDANRDHSSILQRMDESKIKKLHWKVMFISGMGFFTDAYDLFIIGVVMAILKNEWHRTPLQVGLVTSTSLLAAALGALTFGRIADMFGRKRIYGYECLVLSAGALASAFSPNITWLIVFRFILGIGIGGDYPVSATIMSEYAGKASRGMLIGLVFAMQAAGLILGPLLAAGLLATSLSHDWVWRILLAAGAVPPLVVFHTRRTIHETPRYLLAAGRQEEFERASQSIFDEAGETQPEENEHELAAQASFWDGFQKLVSNRRWVRYLIGASAAWFLMDFAYYGNRVSSPLVLPAVSPHQSLLRHTLTELGIFVLAAAPGYFVAAWTMDKLGRKLIQALGFGIMGAAFAAMALIPNIEHLVAPFLLIYGISYFFTEFGPNATTFVYPAEIFPVEGRTTGHGIASATGKLGAFVGVFLFPFLMHWHGLLAAELTAAMISLAGMIITLGMLPETKGKSLEELTQGLPD